MRAPRRRPDSEQRGFGQQHGPDGEIGFGDGQGEHGQVDLGSAQRSAQVGQGGLPDADLDAGCVAADGVDQRQQAACHGGGHVAQAQFAGFAAARGGRSRDRGLDLGVGRA